MNPQIRAAGPSALRIRTSHSSFTILNELVPEFERAAGVEVAIEADSAQTMLGRLKAGEACDAVILGKPMVDELVKLGVVSTDTRPFARARVGVAVRTGAPHPDISSVDAFKRAMLAARSIAHTVHGASGQYVPVMLAKLGILEAMKTRIVTRPGGYIARVVAAGEADVAIQQIVELLAVPGVDVVGPLPDAIQKVFETSAGVRVGSPRSAHVRPLLDFLTAPRHADAYRAKGLDLAHA